MMRPSPEHARSSIRGVDTMQHFNLGNRTIGSISEINPTHHYIRGSDGRLLHAVEWGHGNDCCLLIHGLGDNCRVWDEVAAPFADFYRTLAVDLRGHGDSEWNPNGQYQVECHVADLERLIENLGLQRILLVGHSMGGNIAFRLAARRRSAIAAVISVDFGPNLNTMTMKYLHRQLRSAHQVYSSVAQYEGWLASKQPLVGADTVRRMARSALRRHPDGKFRLKADPKTTTVAESALENEAELWALLASISCPALVVRGAASAILPQQVARRMVDVLPNSQFRLVDCAGHAVIIDNPQGFINGILPFVRGLGTASPRGRRSA